MKQENLLNENIKGHVNSKTEPLGLRHMKSRIDTRFYNVLTTIISFISVITDDDLDLTNGTEVHYSRKRYN